MSIFKFLSRNKSTALVTNIGTGVHMEHPTKIVPISIPDSHRKRHTFVFGTTGVGKTRLCENLIEQDIKKGNSVVYFDPKGDQQIFTKIVEETMKADRLDDLMLITPIFPEYSAVVDPMAYYFMPDELVGHNHPLRVIPKMGEGYSGAYITPSTDSSFLIGNSKEDCYQIFSRILDQREFVHRDWYEALFNKVSMEIEPLVGIKRCWKFRARELKSEIVNRLKYGGLKMPPATAHFTIEKEERHELSH